LFSLEEVQVVAERILEGHPDPVPKYRLLHEVIGLPEGDPDLIRARQELERSKWVRHLQDAQLPDGNWGRFHSQDTKVKSGYRTSEEAIDRAFSLGIDPSHPIFVRAKIYIENVLLGRAHITDRQEKSPAWPLLIRYILAGRLAQIDPTNPILNDYWECLFEIAQCTFKSGRYNFKDEAEAFVSVTNTPVPGGFLESRHALWILSARQLPDDLEQRLVEWIWNKPDGIRYLRAPLSSPTRKTIMYWLRSMNILRRFTTWKHICADRLNHLWSMRDKEGLWDFGSQTSQSADFPLSENWRQVVNRKIDYTTCLLSLFRKYLD
jgi:hypothetical protein